MQHSLYLMPMFISFSLCVFALIFLIFFSRKQNLPEKRISNRHIHKSGISRFGGIAIILSFLTALLLDHHLVITTQLLGIIVCGVLILFFGIVDDLKQINWKTQLFLQVALVAVISIMGVRIQFLSNPLGGIFLFAGGWAHIFGFFIAMVWVVFLMNAMNWVDGIDGASSGIALIATVTIFILSQRPEVNQPPIGIITAALLGSLAAFLLLNFYPAKIIAGTSGSMFMGFILAILAIFAGAKMATTLLVLTVPLLDALWVIFERLLSKNSIFVADKRHLHYRLLDLGWSQKSICLFYYLVTASLSVVALNTKATGKIFSFSFFVLIIVVWLFFVSKKVQLESTNI